MNETIKTKNFTIKELQAALANDGFDYLTVSALVKFLVVTGAVTEVGKQKPESGRGKPSTIYSIPQVVELQFFMDDESSAVPNGTVLPEAEKIVDAPENKDNTNNAVGMVEQVV